MSQNGFFCYRYYLRREVKKTTFWLSSDNIFPLETILKSTAALEAEPSYKKIQL